MLIQTSLIHSTCIDSKTLHVIARDMSVFVCAIIVCQQRNTSKTKENALDMDNIVKASQIKCMCRRDCKFSPDTILRWREKVHTLVQGPQMQMRLHELYTETLMKKGKKETTHFVEGQEVCKYVLYWKSIYFSSY